MVICKQHGCAAPASFRFTWPGKDESVICGAHAPALQSIASTFGLRLKLEPIPPVDPRHALCSFCGRPTFEHPIPSCVGGSLPPLPLWSRVQPPPTLEAFEALKEWTPAELRSAGLVRWDHVASDGCALWLFPSTWFYAVPHGMIVSAITGNSGPWDPAVASSDVRAGCIPYGFRIRHRKEP